MPILRNPRHERFAHEIAQGKSATAAYEAIYSRKDRAAASRLQRRDDVLQRVSELHTERERIQGEATAKAIEAIAYSKEAWFRDLLAIKDRAMQAVPVSAGDGSEETGEWTFQGNVARGALELYAKGAGWIVERKEVKQETTVTDERKSARERVADILGEEATTAHGGDAAGRDPSTGDETLH